MKFRLFVLIGILALAFFFRLYRIDEYMLFLGDEGRDMLIVKRMLVDGKFTLLGPITSVGSMYMGPIYYYIWQLVLAAILLFSSSLTLFIISFKKGKK